MVSEIRQLKLEDFDQRIALSQFAFQMEFSAERIEEARAHFQPEWDYGIFDEDGRLLSKVMIIPFEAWIQGRKFAMGGIAGVASWPDARRKKGVTRLMLHALEVMKKQGQTLSMLAPFSFPFYKKYGYEMTIERKTYTIEKHLLPPRVETPGKVRMAEKDIEVLRPVYEEFASRYSGTLSRDELWWELRVLSKKGQAAVYYNEVGTAEGYILYQVADRLMTVHEWISLTEEAEQALWSYAANHDSMIDRLKVTVPLDDALSFKVPDPRFKQEIEPYFMSRIVNAEGFMAQYPFAESDREDRFLLHLEDGQAPWNDGRFLLRVDQNGNGRMERVSGDTGADEDVLSCDIAALTALLAGGRKASLLHRIGRLRGKADAVYRLEVRVPAHNPYLADFF